MKNRKRLDMAMVDRNLAPSRDKARAMIMAGEVLLGERVVFKPDHRVSPEDSIVIKARYPYVSRGAFKIERAFREFGLSPRDLRVVDIGISSGGFTDYMLQRGAASVTGVDVNIKQVDQAIRIRPEVRLIEKNARFLVPEDIGFEPDLFTIDVSFISVLRVLEALRRFPRTRVLALVKPQFEADRHRVGKGGVVRDDLLRSRILEDLKNKIETLGFRLLAMTEAGIRGRRGNQEFFFLLESGNRPINDDKI